MTTTITLPETLAQQLQQQATKRKRSVEALAIEYLTAALTEEDVASVGANVQPAEDTTELLALVARIQAMPPNPASIIPAKGNLAEVLRAFEAMEDDTYNIEAELAALRSAEAELQAINRADDSAEGRG